MRPADPQLVSVGYKLPELVKYPSVIQLFRYSAVTWNAHKIHFDKSYAQLEGHPDILVQAHLHGAFMIQQLTGWMLPKDRLVKFGWRNRGRAIPGDALRCNATVSDRIIENSILSIILDLVESNQDGTVCAEGQATIVLS